MIERKWQLVAARNPFFSLGIHIDHGDPSITLHLPGTIVACGRLKQPGFFKQCAVTASSIEDLGEKVERLRCRLDAIEGYLAL